MNFTGILLKLHHDQRGRALGRNLVGLAKEVGIVVFQAASLVFQVASLVLVVALVMWVSLGFVDCALLSTHHGDGKSRRAVMSDVKNVVKTIEYFQLQHDRCPLDVDELRTARIVSRIPTDVWGRPFVIECSDISIRVCSRGADEVDPEDDVCHEEFPYQPTPGPGPDAT